MVRIDYMAHQEQYDPNQLLRFAERAGEAGFDRVWTSDHFHPWFHTGGHSGFAWSWLGAASERLDRSMGTCVTPTAGHYHPGLIAQAFSTLQVLHDHPVVLGVSTGEAMNEVPLGFDWPAYPERRQRLEESLEIIRALWSPEEEFVTYEGEYYQLEDARLYTNASESPELHIAANGPSTAALAGRFCEGFITVIKDEVFTEKLYPAVRREAAAADRDPDAIETTLLVTASYHPVYERAFEATKPWWPATQDVFDRALSDPRAIEAEGEKATRAEVEQKFLIADSSEAIVDRLQGYAELGFDRIALGNTSPEPEQFFDVMDGVIGSV